MEPQEDRLPVLADLAEEVPAETLFDALGEAMNTVFESLGRAPACWCRWPSRAWRCATGSPHTPVAPLLVLAGLLRAWAAELAVGGRAPLR